MRFDILTLFPDMVNTVLNESIIGRAQKAGLLEVHCHQIRDFSENKHRNVDDTPYGGGVGMVMAAPDTWTIWFYSERTRRSCTRRSGRSRRGSNRSA